MRRGVEVIPFLARAALSSEAVPLALAFPRVARLPERLCGRLI